MKKLATQTKKIEDLESVVIRFAGDSGDGMQTVGDQFTDSSAILGNDICTFPDFPAEIRAPQGTLPGVSGFQIQVGSKEILTPGDSPDALVAMNPAALKVNLADLNEKGILVVNSDAFTPDNLKKAGYSENPIENGSLESKYHLVKISMTEMTKTALSDSPLKSPQKAQCKNFFALGFMYWVYDRNLDYSLGWIEKKWGKKPEVVEANTKALKAGYYYGETVEEMPTHYRVAKAIVDQGIYRKINGNEAIVLGLVTAADIAKRDLVLGSYPITPASTILEGLAKYKNFNVKTVQAEDEISAIGVAIGASFAGQIGITSTSGPGVCLKSEFMGLAVITELPLIIVSVQRGGPSTGLPTKTEQSDLLQAMFCRNGESPMPILAPKSPSDCFDIAIQAVKIAVTYNTPVMILSDGYIANGAEPWKIPSIQGLPEIEIENAEVGEEFKVYGRNPKTLARKLAIPGTPTLEHRIGGLEKNEEGSVSYDPDNHETMTALRAEKVQRVADMYPPTKVMGKTSGKLLVIGWGGTYGAITSAVDELQKEGVTVSSIHLRYINPFPKDLGKLLKSFETVLVPELNSGQLSLLLRAEYLVDTKTYSKMQGKPFTVSEIKTQITSLL